MRIQVKLWQVITVQLLFLASLVWAADSRITDLTELTDGNVATGDVLEIVDVSDTTDNAAGSSRKVTVQSLETRIHGAGSSTAGSWPVFGNGTVLTTAEDGALEQDADAFYLTTDAGNRGVVPAQNCIRADATRTFTSNTSQQAIFNSPTNGRLTLENGTYLFEALISMDTQSASSGNGKVSLNSGGTATLGSILYITGGMDAALDTLTAWSGVTETTATQSATNNSTAATATVHSYYMKGTFEVTSAGSIIPSYAQTTAAAAVVKIGSFFCANRIGSTSMTNVGQWD